MVVEDWQRMDIEPSNKCADAFSNRTAYPKWTAFDYFKYPINAVILFPIRLIAVASLIGSFALITRIIRLGQSNHWERHEPLSKTRRKLSAFFGILVSRSILFALGFHFVHVRRSPKSSNLGLGAIFSGTQVRPTPTQILSSSNGNNNNNNQDNNNEEKDSKKKNQKNQKNQKSKSGNSNNRGEIPHSPLIVANHTSWSDIFFFLSSIFPGFVAKSGVGRALCVGLIAKSCNSMFVDRGSHESGHDVQVDLNSRFTGEKEYPPLVIFPEGTTTNGSALIQFRQGAFVPGLPVQPVVIRYPHRVFNPAYCEAPDFRFLFYLLTQYYNSMEVEWLDVYYPNPAEQRDPKLYAENVREVMAKRLNVPLREYTSRNKFEFMAQFVEVNVHEKSA